MSELAKMIDHLKTIGFAHEGLEKINGVIYLKLTNAQGITIYI